MFHLSTPDIFCLSATTQPLPALQPAPRLIRVGWLAEPVDCVRQNNWFTVKCKSVILNNEVCGSGTNWRLDGRAEGCRERSECGGVVVHLRRGTQQEMSVFLGLSRAAGPMGRCT